MQRATSTSGIGNAFVSSTGFTRASHGLDASRDIAAQEAIHKLYMATMSLGEGPSTPRRFKRPVGDSMRGATNQTSVSTFSPLHKAASSSFSSGFPCQGATVSSAPKRPPELLPPVTLDPPMCLEDVVMDSRWQRSRAGQGNHRKGAAVPDRGSSKSRSQSSLLIPAARRVLEDREITKETRFKVASSFTDGRRRVALIKCLDDLKRENVDLTLGEISKRLMREGLQHDEVQDHLLLLADDTDKWNVKSLRELDEVRPEKPSYSSLPAIARAFGGSGQVECAAKVKNMVEAFRYRKLERTPKKTKERTNLEADVGKQKTVNKRTAVRW